MDEEFTLYPIHDDLKSLQEELEDEKVAPKVIKDMIMKPEEFKKNEWDLNLNDYKLNQQQLEGFTQRVIAHRKKIRAKAKDTQELRQQDGPLELNEGPLPNI